MPALFLFPSFSEFFRISRQPATTQEGRHCVLWHANVKRPLTLKLAPILLVATYCWRFYQCRR